MSGRMVIASAVAGPDPGSPPERFAALAAEQDVAVFS